MSIGVCVPCATGHHQDCDGPRRPTLGCECIDGGHVLPRVRTYDRDGEPHDEVLRTKTGMIVTEAMISKWADEAEE